MIEDDKSGGNGTESTETLRETKPSSTAPAAVGFWDPALQETRKRIIYLWGRTGESFQEHYMIPKLLNMN
jgi:hypothetical protein